MLLVYEEQMYLRKIFIDLLASLVIDNSCVPGLSVAGKVEGFPANIPLLQLNQKAFLVHLLVQCSSEC